MTAPIETDFETVELPLDTPFTIARGTTTSTENVVVSISYDGATGYGAAAPARRYGETIGTVETLVPELLEVVSDVGDPFARRQIADRMRERVRGNAAARAAVDVALWDLAGNYVDQPVYRLLGVSPDETVPTSYTIGIDDPETMQSQARRAAQAGFPVLKLKLGTTHDLEIVERVREAVEDVRIRVDANEAWTPTEAVRNIENLTAFDVEFVEQPVPAGDADGLQYVYERSPLPIAADESCRTAADVPDVADRCDIANLKLMKTGGLTPALELIHTARAHDLSVMCGCMLESNASIAAGAQLLPLLDFADLDGSLLLASDPYEGVPVEDGRFALETVERGTGVRPA